LCPIRERTPVRCKCCTLTAQIPSDIYLFFSALLSSRTRTFSWAA
jgi:hypothetical protein